MFISQHIHVLLSISLVPISNKFSNARISFFASAAKNQLLPDCWNRDVTWLTFPITVIIRSNCDFRQHWSRSLQTGSNWWHLSLSIETLVFGWDLLSHPSHLYLILMPTPQSLKTSVNIAENTRLSTMGAPGNDAEVFSLACTVASNSGYVGVFLTVCSHEW